MAQDAVAAQAEIAKLRFQLARYRRAEFGRSSEKLAREVEQLELAIEALEADQAERLAAASPVVAAAIEDAAEAQKPARRPLPEHLPREEVTASGRLQPARTCGGALRRIGEDVTETLDYVPGRFKVIRHVAREALLPGLRYRRRSAGARSRDRPRPRRRRAARPYRRLEVRRSPAALPPGRDLRPRRRRAGDLDAVRLGRGDGGGPQPAGRRARRRGDGLATHCMSTTRRCRCWRRAPARPRPAGCGPMSATSGRSPASGRRRRCSSTRPTARASTRERHLKDFRGVIHADGYAGFNELFAGGRIAEAACWAHVRRKFFDVHAATGSPIAKEALDRIGELYQVEETINGVPPDHRRRERQQRSKPIAEALAAWADETLPQAVAQIRTCRRLPLHARALAGAVALLR